MIIVSLYALSTFEYFSIMFSSLSISERFRRLLIVILSYLYRFHPQELFSYHSFKFLQPSLYSADPFSSIISHGCLAFCLGNPTVRNITVANANMQTIINSRGVSGLMQLLEHPPPSCYHTQLSKLPMNAFECGLMVFCLDNKISMHLNKRKTLASFTSPY